MKRQMSKHISKFCSNSVTNQNTNLKYSKISFILKNVTVQKQCYQKMTVIAKKVELVSFLLYHNIKEEMPSRQNLNSNIISYFEIFKSLVLHSGILPFILKFLLKDLVIQKSQAVIL